MVLIPNYVAPYKPLTNITPFTYRDGETYLTILERLRAYVNETLVEFINTEYTNLGNNFELEVNELIASVNTALDATAVEVAEQLAAQNLSVTAQLNTQNTNVNTIVTDLTTYVNEQVALIINASIELNDTILNGIITDNEADSTVTLRNIIRNKRIIANDPRYGVPYTRAAVINAIDAAEAMGRGTIIEFPAGIYDVGTGISLAGKSCQIRGEGAHVRDGGTSPHAGTVFFASTQNGPVLDFSGYLDPFNFRGRIIHSGFVVQGSGVSDPTKANSGMKMTSLSSTLFSDIAILDTGGPGINGAVSSGDAVYLMDFERITISTPIDAEINDVPYLYMSEANGVRFRSIGFRSIVTSNDCGASGALVVDSPPTFGSALSLFDGCWFENLHVPNNGTLVNVYGRKHTFNDFQFFDCFKIPGATETSHFRFNNAPGVVQGANIVSGIIPGRDPDYTNSIDYGVDLKQSYNRITGVKGRNGYNVKIATAITAFVELGGSQFAATTAAVVQEGTAATGTVIIDAAVRTSIGWSKVGTAGVVYPLSNLSANVTLTDANNIVVINNTGVTVTLPDPSTVDRGRSWTVKNIAAGAITVVSAGTSKTIDGAASDSLAQWESGTYVSNGTNWVVI